ncbi:MAG TPA: type II toxin-antitoxin system VapC family toxin [Terriglobales bacterium]|nr:type II toxin-antitoxin system VapC family toxin [Terriglobales bacterium]
MVVLDASAVLAAILGEAGHEKLTPELLNSAICSTVNLAEVQAKLISSGLPPDDAIQTALIPVREAVDFTAAQAGVSSSLIPHTRSLGLSLGDRACLALGISLGVPVYSADRAWKNLKLPVRIHVIR